jgi:hypothetical protein
MVTASGPVLGERPLLARRSGPCSLRRSAARFRHSLDHRVRSAEEVQAYLGLEPAASARHPLPRGALPLLTARRRAYLVLAARAALGSHKAETPHLREPRPRGRQPPASLDERVTTIASESLVDHEAAESDDRRVSRRPRHSCLSPRRADDIARAIACFRLPDAHGPGPTRSRRSSHANSAAGHHVRLLPPGAGARRAGRVRGLQLAGWPSMSKRPAVSS